MNVLVLYSSTEGQTKKVAERVAAQVEAAGHRATVHHMGSDQKPPSIPEFDAVIAAASVHQGFHQESAINFIAAQAGNLNRKRSAFISVSLSAALAEGRAEAQDYVERFLETTGWKPARCLLLAGAVRLSSYDYFERQVMKYIIAQKGVAHDLHVDYECTDWSELTAFVDTFLGLSSKPGAESPDARPNAE
jgi:menaquinone-dependent protoporphyrinogen oxidase